MPRLTGRRALVTGVTSGLGTVVARELARAGAEVVMAARNPAKLDTVLDRLRPGVSEGSLRPLTVDLADLSSVRRAASTVTETYDRLDLLVGNAGVMATPSRRTADGLDRQMATNHFGHFALTGLLWPLLLAADSARVVAVSSQAHRAATAPPLDDPRAGRPHRPDVYWRWQVYARSKLANLMFALELDRRARALGLPVAGVAAHPGMTATALMPPDFGLGRAAGQIGVAAFRLVGQSPEMGALPILMAATADLPPGAYVGPDGPFQARGLPRLVSPSRLARDVDAARRLWEISEDVTGVHFP